MQKSNERAKARSPLHTIIQEILEDIHTCTLMVYTHIFNIIINIFYL